MIIYSGLFLSKYLIFMLLSVIKYATLKFGITVAFLTWTSPIGLYTTWYRVQYVSISRSIESPIGLDLSHIWLAMVCVIATVTSAGHLPGLTFLF